MTPTKQTTVNKISVFFKTIFGLFLFASKSIWLILWDDMKKESQEQKEEQKKRKK